MKKNRKITAILAATLLAFTTTACRAASAPSPEPTTTGGTDRITVFHATLDTLADVVSKLQSDSTIIMSGPVTSNNISTISNIIQNSSFAINLDLKNVTGLDSIPNSGFKMCNRLKSIKLPDTVKSLGWDAFDLCTSLVSIEIPDSVDTIGVYAFSYCFSLTSITIPASVTTIDGALAPNCQKLTEIIVDSGNTNYVSENGVLFNKGKTTLIQCPAGKEGAYIIPSTVTEIANSSFNGCNKLTEITIPNLVTYIGHDAFSSCTKLSEIGIPNSVVFIGNSAFSSCLELSEIVIPNSVTSLGTYAFSSCSKATTLTISNKITSIPSSCFSSCSSLTSVSIPNSVTSIGSSAFSSCSKLESVIIPNSVTTIGGYAFRYCSKLSEASIPDSVTTIENEAFLACDLTDVFIPKSVTTIKPLSFACNVQTFTVDNDNQYYKSIDGVLFSKDEKNLISFPGKRTGTYSIPQGTEIIDEDSFWSSKLSCVTIPDTVTTFNYGAFRYSEELEEFIIPSSTTLFGHGILYGCTKLTSVTFNDTNGWYSTNDSISWQNKTNGTSIDVSDAAANATYFKENLTNYWYKESN